MARRLDNFQGSLGFHSCGFGYVCKVTLSLAANLHCYVQTCCLCKWVAYGYYLESKLYHNFFVCSYVHQPQ